MCSLSDGCTCSHILSTFSHTWNVTCVGIYCSLHSVPACLHGHVLPTCRGFLLTFYCMPLALLMPVQHISLPVAGLARRIWTLLEEGTWREFGRDSIWRHPFSTAPCPFMYVAFGRTWLRRGGSTCACYRHGLPGGIASGDLGPSNGAAVCRAARGVVRTVLMFFFFSTCLLPYRVRVLYMLVRRVPQPYCSFPLTSQTAVALPGGVWPACKHCLTRWTRMRRQDLVFLFVGVAYLEHSPVL